MSSRNKYLLGFTVFLSFLQLFKQWISKDVLVHPGTDGPLQDAIPSSESASSTTTILSCPISSAEIACKILVKSRSESLSTIEPSGTSPPLKILINYASGCCELAQRRNCETGLAAGGFDACFMFNQASLDADFMARHQAIMKQPRGAGYWLWKSYIIGRMLEHLPPGTILFYSDAAADFSSNVEQMLGEVLADGRDVGCFYLVFPETHWTKRDAFILMEVDHLGRTAKGNGVTHPEERQRLGSFMVFRSSNQSRTVVQDWFRYSSDERILTDLPNTMNQPDFPGFEEHRHDQSVWSLITKKHGIPAFRDPSHWGEWEANQNSNYHRGTFGTILQHHRDRR